MNIIDIEYLTIFHKGKVTNELFQKAGAYVRYEVDRFFDFCKVPIRTFKALLKQKIIDTENL